MAIILDTSLEAPNTSPVALLKFFLATKAMIKPPAKPPIIPRIPTVLKLKNPINNIIISIKRSFFIFIAFIKNLPVPSSNGLEKVQQVTNPTLADISDINRMGNTMIAGMVAIAANVIMPTINRYARPPVPIL